MITLPYKTKGGQRVNQPGDFFNLALEKSRAAAAVGRLTDVSVEAGLKCWLNLHTIGNKPRSVDYNIELVKFIRTKWSDVLKTPVKEVTEEQCIAFAESISHYSFSRYNAVVNALRSFIPAARSVPRKPVKHYDHTNVIPTPEQFDQLLAALDTAQIGYAGLVIRFLAHTGMRINEARMLNWANAKEDHIYAPAEVTKSGKPRCIPFIKGTKEVLKALRLVSINDRILPQGICHKALGYASRLAGLPKYGHHTFRHYFATRCILSGVDIPTVAKWLGHQDNGVLLLRTYCHLLDEHSVEMAERVKLGAKLANPETLVSLHPDPTAKPPGCGESENIIMFQFRPPSLAIQQKALS